MRAITDAGYRAVGTSIFGVNRIRARDGASGASARPLHVLRCTVRGDADATFIRRVLAADKSLFWRFRVKETALRHLRSSLGPTRYARWRRGFLNAVRGGA